MKMHKLIRFVSVASLPIAGLVFGTYNLKAQPTASIPQSQQSQIHTSSRPAMLGQWGLRTLDTQTKHVEMHLLRNGYDCYVSGRKDKNGVLHDVVVRSYFPYKVRNSDDSAPANGVFPEVCLAKSMSPDLKTPNQWILEGAMYHIFKTDGTQLQETPTNAQQPKVITLLPITN